MKFIKGKWYKGVGSSTGDILIGKFDFEKNRNFYCINRNFIRNGKYSQYDAYTSGLVNVNDMKEECSYEEYSKYLPDGHPDKQSKEIELVEGNWYTGGNNWLFKFDYWTFDGFVHMTKACDSRTGDKTISGGTLSNVEKSTIKLADLELVYKYFPEERPKDEFLKGEILTDEEVIFKNDGINKFNTSLTSGFRINNSMWMKENQFRITKDKLRKCDKDETEWYFSCERANKFIPKEEALKSMEKQELSSLPEKWCIRSSEKEVADYCNLITKTSGYSTRECGNSYAHFPRHDGCTTKMNIAPGYTEITFEQFKKWVMLKEEIPNIKPMEEYCVIIDSGSGMNPADKGKLVIKLSKKPLDGKIANPHYPEGVWIKPIPGEIYITLKGYDYGNCAENMLRIATSEEIAKLLPNKPMETPVNEDWCVKVTPENKQDIIEWGRKKGKGTDGTAQYYGELSISGYNFSNKSWGKVLTTEEFYAKIGKTVPKKEEKNLVGRYLKYIGDNVCGPPKHGDFFLVENMSSNGLFRLSDKEKNCHWTPSNYSQSFELMPEGFIPPNKEDNRFVVGKWYKTLHGDISYYCKFQKLGSRNNLSGEAIINGKDNTYLKDYCFEPGYDWKLLTDISEIQNYLPAGHSDKLPEKPKVMETFNVGDWVKVIALSVNRNAKDGNNTLCKIGDVFKVIDTETSQIYTGQKWIKGWNGQYNAIISSLLTKALPHEIPSGNVYIHEFKIGDKVRCIGESKTNKDGKSAAGWQKGYEFTINQITGYNNIAWPGINNCGVYFDQLELVTTNSSIPEYVECIKEGYFCELDQVGKIYKTSDPFPKLKACEGLKWDKVWSDNKDKYFKVSTYSAYMDQQALPVLSEKDALLQKAKLDYPVGTQFVCVHLGHNKTVTNDYHIDGSLCIRTCNGGACLYSPSQGWAKVLNKPQESLLEEAKRRFPIGVVVDSLGGTTNCLIKHHDFYYCSDKRGVRMDGDTLVYLDGKWAHIKDSIKQEYPYKPEECYEKNVELIIPRKEARIDTSVNNVNSVSVQLVKPKKVVYF